MELLDDALVLLEPGDVMVIGARPAVGKSAFVTQIISTLSAEGKTGALYNLKMSEKQVYERMLSRTSGIELKRVRKAKAYLSDERKRVELANKELREYNMYLHSGPVKPSEIRSECKYIGLDYIVIDYLQLMQSDQWYPNRVNEVGAISKAVKAIAMDLKVPIILLSQLNRTVKREPQRSRNYKICESLAILNRMLPSSCSFGTWTRMMLPEKVPNLQKIAKASLLRWNLALMARG